MFSGIFRISVSTVPACLRRSSSFATLAAQPVVASNNAVIEHANILVFIGPPKNENRVAVTPSWQPTSKPFAHGGTATHGLPIEKSSPRSLRAPFQTDQVFQCLHWHLRIKPPTSKTKNRSHVTDGKIGGLLQTILYRQRKRADSLRVRAKKSARRVPRVNERYGDVSPTD